MHEQELISHIFQNKQPRDASVIVPSGDDAAVVRMPAEMDLVLSIDTMIEGRHFLPGDNPRDLGYRILAISLSDCAAMGALPKWVTVSLSMPASDEAWFSVFAEGFFELANAVGVTLIGGDLSRGPLSMTSQIHGWVKKEAAILQSTARPGDDLYVSGTLGDAAMGLYCLKQKVARSPAVDSLIDRYHRPPVRVELGLALQGLARSMIDLSDGFLMDLRRLLTRSGVGAQVHQHALPLSSHIKLKSMDAIQHAWDCALYGGDDYELCFTADPAHRARIEALASQLNVPIARVGVITDQPDARLILESGEAIIPPHRGFEHF
ncbi:MAG: thiamine-phosphate kinase [Gammaproteobacteria bacterium]|nr:thiamine-phosphate kinase [Gammaproteobacteria bacterium]